MNNNGSVKAFIEYDKKTETISYISFSDCFGNYYNEIKKAPHKIWFDRDQNIIRECIFKNGHGHEQVFVYI